MAKTQGSTTICIRLPTQLMAAIAAKNEGETSPFGRRQPMTRTIVQILERGMSAGDQPTPRVVADRAWRQFGESWVYGEREAIVFKGQKSWQYVSVLASGEVSRGLGYDSAELAMAQADFSREA